MADEKLIREEADGRGTRSGRVMGASLCGRPADEDGEELEKMVRLRR